LRQKTVDFARTPPHPVFCQWKGHRV
jgi:hypothetical protein